MITVMRRTQNKPLICHDSESSSFRLAGFRVVFLLFDFGFAGSESDDCISELSEESSWMAVSAACSSSESLDVVPDLLDFDVCGTIEGCA